MQGYYRILTPLSYGGEILRKNTVHWLRLKPENITKLIETKAIAPIRTPPLSEIPELEQYTERLHKKGITTLQQFLEADYEQLKTIWRRKDHIEKHKENLIQTYLIVPDTEKPCNC